MHDWLDNADRMDVCRELSRDHDVCIHYIFGQLLGIADFQGSSVLELLEDFEVPLFTDTETPDLHEGLERLISANSKDGEGMPYVYVTELRKLLDESK